MPTVKQRENVRLDLKFLENNTKGDAFASPLKLLFDYPTVT